MVREDLLSATPVGEGNFEVQFRSGKKHTITGGALVALLNEERKPTMEDAKGIRTYRPKGSEVEALVVETLEDLERAKAWLALWERTWQVENDRSIWVPIEPESEFGFRVAPQRVLIRHKDGRFNSHSTDIFLNGYEEAKQKETDNGA